MNSTGIAQKGFFATLIGKKTLMALTGLFLCTFLIIHASGNLQLFKNDGGQAFNEYSVFMTTNPLIKTVSYLLYASILAHAIDGLILTLANRRARPKRYAVNRPQANSTWASRNMGLLGSVILVFIVIHMRNFWFEYKFGSSMAMVDYGDGEIKDLYSVVANTFKDPLYALFYVFSMLALSYHLYHGFQSGFQTLGINHPKYTPAIKSIGIWLFAVILPVAFAAMPLYFLLKN
jgi:succinate dehydrogenase / fumarate reductase, cytochrome b subunit